MALNRFRCIQYLLHLCTYPTRNAIAISDTFLGCWLIEKRHDMWDQLQGWVEWRQAILRQQSLGDSISILRCTNDRTVILFFSCIRQAESKRPGMDPNVKILEEWISTYAWKAIIMTDSLVIVYLVVSAVVCMYSGVKIKCVTWKWTFCVVGSSH